MTYTDKALLLSEWSSVKGAMGIECCPVCHGDHVTHKPDCVMDLALSERGFFTQEERNRARTFITVPFAPTLPPPSKP